MDKKPTRRDIKNREEQMKMHIQSFVEDVVPEDFEINEEIADTAIRLLQTYFIVDLSSVPLLPLVVYNLTFNEICEFIKGKRKDYDSYCLNMCNYFKIGYTNQYDDDNEKNGNFVPAMESIKHNMTFDVPSINDTPRSIATVWCAKNIVESHEMLMTIASKVIKYIYDEFDVSMGGAELLYPIFCITHAAMERVLKLKLNSYTDNADPEQISSNFSGSEYQINFAGCYRVGAAVIEDENGNPDYANPEILFYPAVYHKTGIKSDAGTSQQYE